MLGIVSESAPPGRAVTVYGWRAQPPALAVNSCGCFLPDLTRFTTLRCGAARRRHYERGRHPARTFLSLGRFPAPRLSLLRLRRLCARTAGAADPRTGCPRSVPTPHFFRPG